MDTDNQQVTIPDTDLAWIAGIIDGDGNIQISIPKNKKTKSGRTINMWIDITNSDPMIINKCISIFEAMGVKHLDGQKFIKPVYKEDGTYWQSKTKYCIWTRITRLIYIEKFLEQVIPFLNSYKKGLGEIMLRFVKRRVEKNRKPYDEGDIMLVQEFMKTADGRYAARNIEYLDRLLRDYTPSTV